MLYSPEKYKRTDLVDFNLEAALLKGDLDEKLAKITLAKFLRRNIGFTTELLTGIKLAPYQIITIRALLNRNYSLCVWGRGCSKSFIASIYCILQVIFQPNANILIAGPTFRTARFIFTHIENIVESKNGKLVADCMGVKFKRNDEFRWKVNGGSIVAIPLNGEKIRGFRANILVIDEFLLMSEEMVEKVLTPYLVAAGDIGDRIRIRAKEDELIKRGLLKEEERKVFENKAKMIALSSASYKCEYLARKFESYLKEIYDPTPSPNKVTYFVSNMAWNAIPEYMLDKAVIEASKGNEGNTANFNREYGAQFIDGSDSYFSMNKMIACTVKDGDSPTLLLRGVKGRKYIISIDPNASNSANSDHFAMGVIELDDDLMGATLVHQYARAGKDLKDNIKYFYYLYRAFTPEMIVIDNAGYQFIEAANENELFRKDKIDLNIFEFSAEKDGAEAEEQLRKARNLYNKQIGRIAFTQVFTSEFIRKGNEWLQGCIDFKRIWFGGCIKGNAEAHQKAIESNVDLSLLGLSKEGESSGETVLDFITEQEVLISQVKYQCASIEVRTTSKGTQSFDLPQMMKRDTSSKRMRKDSYTCLMLACWAMKAYSDILKVPEETKESFIPFMV